MNKNSIRAGMIIILLIGIWFLSKPLSFYSVLIKNGYSITKYKTYKTVNQTSKSEEKIIKVFNYQGEFNYILLSKNRNNHWVLLKEGQQSTAEDEYATLMWTEYSISIEPDKLDEGESKINTTTHRIFDVANEKVNQVLLENIPLDLKYEVSNKDGSYTIDIYTISPKNEEILQGIEIKEIFSFR